MVAEQYKAFIELLVRSANARYPDEVSRLSQQKLSEMLTPVPANLFAAIKVVAKKKLKKTAAKKKRSKKVAKKKVTKRSA